MEEAICILERSPQPPLKKGAKRNLCQRSIFNKEAIVVISDFTEEAIVVLCPIIETIETGQNKIYKKIYKIWVE